MNVLARFYSERMQEAEVKRVFIYQITKHNKIGTIEHTMWKYH